MAQACILGHRAHDKPAFFFFGDKLHHFLAQLLAFLLIRDALRNADMGVLGQVDQHTTGDRNLGR